MSDRSETPGRWAWHTQAHIQFARELPGDLATYFDRPNGRASVVLAGRTQVGKTTLALALVGVDLALMHIAENVLRMDRGAGRSATARPVRYVRSGRAAWTLREGSGPVLEGDGAAVRGLLKEARQHLEKGRTTDTVMEVGVPDSLFTVGADDGLDVAVTDLPGIDTRNRMEAEQARDLFLRHATHADVALVCLRSDQLNLLQPGETLRTVVEPLIRATDRVRLVITHAMQPQDVHKRVAPDLTAMLAYYRFQLGTFDDLGPDEFLTRIVEERMHLFDGGKSRRTEAQGSRAHSCAVDGSTADLRDSIGLAAVESTRRISAATAQRIIVRYHHSEATKHAEMADGVGQQITEIDQRRGQVADHLARRTVVFVERRLRATAVEQLGVPGCAEVRVTVPTGKFSGTDARKAVRDTRTSLLAECQQSWETWSDKANGADIKLQPPRWRAVADAVGGRFDEVMDCCGDCHRSWLRPASAHPGNCVEQLVSRNPAATRAVREEMGKLAQEQVDKVAAGLRLDIAGVDSQRRGLERAKASLDREYVTLTELQDNARQAQAASDAHAVRADDVATRLGGHLRSAAARQIHGHLAALVSTTNPSQRLGLMLAAIRDRQDLEALEQ